MSFIEQFLSNWRNLLKFFRGSTTIANRLINPIKRQISKMTMKSNSNNDHPPTITPKRNGIIGSQRTRLFPAIRRGKSRLRR